MTFDLAFQMAANNVKLQDLTLNFHLNFVMTSSSSVQFK